MAHADIPIPKSTVVLIDSVAEDVRGLRIALVNVFGATYANGSRIMINAEPPFSATHIRHWAEEQLDLGPLATARHMAVRSHERSPAKRSGMLPSRYTPQRAKAHMGDDWMKAALL